MAGRQYKLYALGNAIMDLQLFAEDKDLEALGLEKAAMKLFDQPGQQKLHDYFKGRAIKQSSGGSAANTVIAFAQLGGKTAYASLIADDPIGKQYGAEMEQLGVHLHNKPIAGGVTGTSLIVITPDSERTMNTHLGVSGQMTEAHVSEDIVKQSDWVYVEGYKFTDEGGQRSIDRLVSLAKAAGTKISVTCSDGFIVEIFKEPFLRTLAACDLVFANKNEACRFAGTDDENVAFAALCKAAPNCVMTRSAEGAWVNWNGVVSKIQPFSVKAIDDTGAGDIFAGAFLYGVTHGLSGEQAGRLACFLASRVVSQVGPRLHGDIRALCREAEVLA